MLKDNYEVEIIINGKPAKEYSHKSKIYIEGRQGTKFSIRIRNNSYCRKLFVPTIDGLSVMNGEEGKFDSSGYIVQGHRSITIDGWRTSDKEVASFYFSSPEGSYRKQMKRGDNLGIIGVAVFEEVQSYTMTTSTPFRRYHDYGPEWINSINTISYGTFDGGNTTVAMCCSSGVNGSTPTQQLGTGFGEQKNSEVISVIFERASKPDTIFEIHYNTREELEKSGISLKKEPLYVTPQAFPGQYCKPPQN